MDARDYDLVSFPPRFRSKEVEGRFRDEDARATLPNLRGLSILSLIIVVVFDFTDALFAEEVLGSLRLIRFGGSFPIVAGFFALTFWRGFPRSRDVILPLAFALCWATVVALLTVFPNTVDLAALGWTGAGTGPIPLADGKLFFLMGFVLTMLFGGVAGGVVAFRPSAVIALGTVPVILIGQRLLGASVFSLAFGALSSMLSGAPSASASGSCWIDQTPVLVPACRMVASNGSTASANAESAGRPMLSDVHVRPPSSLL